jgi:hypothetical protein
MRFAFVNDNKVVKIEDLESYESIPNAHTYQNVIDISAFSPQPVVGWFYEKGRLLSNLTPLTPRQLRLSLLAAGITADIVVTAINGFPEPNRTYALIEWEYAVEIKRSEALVAGLGMVLGLTAEQIDLIWINGAKI